MFSQIVVVLMILGVQDAHCGRVLISRSSEKTSPSSIREMFALPPKEISQSFAFDKIILENEDSKSVQTTIESNSKKQTHDFSFHDPKSLIKPEKLVKPQYFPDQSQNYQWTQGLHSLASLQNHNQEEYENNYEDLQLDYPRLNEVQGKPLIKFNPVSRVNFTIQPSNPEVKPHLRVLSVSVNKGKESRSSKPIKRIVRRMRTIEPKQPLLTKSNIRESSTGAASEPSPWVELSSRDNELSTLDENPKPKRNIGLRTYQGQKQPSYSANRDVIPIIKQVGNMQQSGERRFFFEYEGGNGIKRNEEGFLEDPTSKNPIQVIQGSYSYPGPNGKVYSITYIADENGFRASGEHIPK